MSDLIKEIVTGLVENAVKELLGKSHGRAATKRTKRKTKSATTTTRSATTGRFVKKKATRTRATKPARKQVSRRRTTSSRSKQRSR